LVSRRNFSTVKTVAAVKPSPPQISSNTPRERIDSGAASSVAVLLPAAPTSGRESAAVRWV
jgi:hypothetical protein